jgi:hypothetical protein
MHTNLIINNYLSDYGLLIACGLIIGFSSYYFLKSNFKAISSKNMEALRAENMEAISQAKIDPNLTDSDLNTDSETDHDTVWDSDSSSDTDTDTENAAEQLEIYYLPFVDLDVCSIQELKLFELHSLYSEQIAAKNLTDEDLMEIITFFTDAELCSIYVNQWIIVAINNFEIW